MYTASLDLEWIGYDADRDLRVQIGLRPLRKPSVCRIRDTQSYPCRQYLRGNIDFRTANGIASRGVYLTYLLEDGCVYEVRHHVSWKRRECYFALIAGGQVRRISEEELECRDREALLNAP